MDTRVALIAITFSGLISAILCLGSNGLHYTDEWAVEVRGGEKVARQLARDYGFILVDRVMDDIYTFRHSRVAKRSKIPSKFYHRSLAQDNNVIWLQQQVAKKRVKRQIHTFPEFNDPKWHAQWYLHRGKGLDMNVREAWAMGVTGKGVAVTILDDGIETTHPDLKRNFDGKASYDVNGHDQDPTPRYEYTNENRHGTRCAGEVAAQSNNSDCSVGAAYDAKIGGVRMLDGDVTDSVEATSLSFNSQHIHIYSASWGPDDDGRTVDGPATLARKAFYDGITRGRGGLGSIFVWASGNGGRDYDSCNCDGYTNSIYTLSISSATEGGKIPWYSEACSSTLATTYSSGSADEKQIVTTDINKGCTETHTGTSASAPLAAGLCALALQANPMLTWRDLQHIVVNTAKPDNLHDDTWMTNGVGKKVSHSFGYGLMDAAAMVKLARNWTTVPPQSVCEIRYSEKEKPVPTNAKILVPLYTDGCEGTDHHVKYLEHVQARITLKASRRGDVQIYLQSPMGTKSTLLAKRKHDSSREGFNNWAFMTTHNWGELSKGDWVLTIENSAHISVSQYKTEYDIGQARLIDWVLVFYGTDRKPQEQMTSTTTTTTTHTPTELQEWTLLLRGTETHPQARNVTPPSHAKDRPFTCSGITSHGVCIECRPGFYKLKDGCVADCPENYYGVMQMVQLRSTANTSTSRPKYQRQGMCNACNEACRTCKGPLVADCFDCKDGYELIDEQCQKKLLLNFLDPDMLGFFIWVIVLCIAAIILFGVIFGLLQARDRQLLCWKGKGAKERNKCDYKGINLTQEELENDLENFDIIRNRTFRHASIPESHEPRIHVNNLESVVKFTLDSQSNSSVNKLDKYNSRNNLGKYNSSSRNSHFDGRSDFIPTTQDFSQKNNYQHCDSGRKSRHSDKSLRRNYTDSYVSYDINSSLTQTLAKDLDHRGNSSTRGQSSNQNVFHGSRSAAAFRH